VNERFANRTCLVTGAGRGIGRAIACALAHEGAQVGLVARTASQCEEVATEIGDSALAIPADVADANSVERAFAALEKHFGRPTIVVNAAGISPVRQRAELHDLDGFRQIIDVNLIGAFTVARTASRALLAAGGAIVNVASAVGSVASPRLAGYGASKAGVIQLTRTLAREWADRNVRINVVCPGYVETEMTAAMLAVDHLREQILGATPLGRFATLDEIVEPVLFLASDASSYITGAALVVDGAMTA
jgi:NAD(P)-dependent dehydrogenase (short-subunit alcohol dehydrogenase family)